MDLQEFQEWSPKIVERCIRDVDINELILKDFMPHLTSPRWRDALRLEHDIALVCNELHKNGFSFDITKAREIHKEITEKTNALLEEFQKLFPPKTKFIREVHPKQTKFGTLNRSDFRFLGNGADLSPYSVESPFSLFEWEPFNPSSPKQIVERLNEAGWKPINKTDGHIEAEDNQDDERLAYFRTYGWKVDETNLGTLSDTAPEGARKLASYLTLLGRLRRLEEWFKNYNETTGRIHGNFNGLGAWTHRFSHDNPNMANIPRVFPLDKAKTPVEKIQGEYNGRLRELWTAGANSLLVAVDADSIQLRVLAHYINDPEFTHALVRGDKKLGTDAHSINQQRLNRLLYEGFCKTRDHAKTFIYAWCLGAGINRTAEIFECPRDDAKVAREGFVEFYPGLRDLKKHQIPADAKRGYFEGFDGRYVLVSSEHLVLAGYLQNGESVIMKRAMLRWMDQLRREKIPFKPVNFVHDEWQTEVPNDLALAQYVGKVQQDAIRTVAEDMNLRCPFAGGEPAIGRNWKETH